MEVIIYEACNKIETKTRVNLYMTYKTMAHSTNFYKLNFQMITLCNMDIFKRLDKSLIKG